MSLNKARRHVPSLDVKNLFQQHIGMVEVLRVQAVDKYVTNTASVTCITRSERVKLGSTVMTARFKVCGRSKNSQKMRDGNVLLSVTCHRSA